MLPCSRSMLLTRGPQRAPPGYIQSKRQQVHVRCQIKGEQPTQKRWLSQPARGISFGDRQFHGWWDRLQQEALYNYFKWRQDAFSDLQAIAVLGLVAWVLAAAVKVCLLGESKIDAWDDFYAAAVTVFGQDFPPRDAAVPDQVFSIGLYLAGLVGFAVLLALVEQSVLQVYESRVELGSPVFESGHLLVLGWCRSQADISKLEVILQQLCAAYSCSVGRTIVVLSQRKKTDMEDIFTAAIPQQQRGGSKFVFRQGNPLTAADLKLVAADEASAVLVLADSAVSNDASDSQVLRVLVLLDELEAAAKSEGLPRPKPGHVVAEILSNDALPLLRFMPIKAVLSLPAHRVNAIRLAQLITRPVVSGLTDTLWDFSNTVALYIHSFPQLAGQAISDVALRFEDGIVLGLLEPSTGFVLINPPAAYKLNAEEHIILLRPTRMREIDVQPLLAPVPAPIGNFNPEAAAAAWRRSQQSLSMPMVVSCGCDMGVPAEGGLAGMDNEATMPIQQEHQQQLEQIGSLQQQQLASLQPEPVQQSKDQQQQQQQQGMGTLDLQQPIQDVLEQLLEPVGMDQVTVDADDDLQVYNNMIVPDPDVTVSSGGVSSSNTKAEIGTDSSNANGSGVQIATSNGTSQGANGTGNGAVVAAAAAGSAVDNPANNDKASSSAGGSANISSNGRAVSERSSVSRVSSLAAAGGRPIKSSWDLSSKDKLPSYEVMDLLRKSRPGFNTCRMFSLEESSMQLDRNRPVDLLVLGWGDMEFMTQLLLALGTGFSALPAGSKVTFVNAHSADVTLGPALAAAGPSELLSGLTLHHIQCDPLLRGQLGGSDLTTINAVIILCDVSWRQQAASDTTNFAVAAAAAAGVLQVQPAAQSDINSSSSPNLPYTASLPAANGISSGNGSSSNSSSAFGGSGGGGQWRGGADADVLQLDALLLRVQLNLRSLLYGVGREKEVNIISEKIGTEQDTRFEDKSRLPLGVPVNLSSYTACMMSQLAFCPLMVLPRTLGSQIDPLIVDADLYTDVGDKVSFWQLVRRAQLLGHVLLGYYVLPVSASDPIEAVVCPPKHMRYERRVWNEGDNRLKFVVLQDADATTSRSQQTSSQQEEQLSRDTISAAASLAEGYALMEQAKIRLQR